MVPTFISGEFYLWFCNQCWLLQQMSCDHESVASVCLHLQIPLIVLLDSGLKGMMPGIQDMLKGVAEKKGLDYDEWLKGLKAKKQWHVEVY